MDVVEAEDSTLSEVDPHKPSSATTRLPPHSAPGTPSSSSRRARTPSSGGAQFYAGFHFSDDNKITALLHGLNELWSSPMGLHGDFIDLGCGDGRVVLEVGRAFPDRKCIGVELQSSLVEKAKTLAKQQRLGGNCTFHAGDLAAVDLSEASVVFLYFPPMALPALLKVLTASNLRNGAMVVSADGAWKSRDAQERRAGHRHAAWEHTQSELLELLQPWRGCWGSADLYFYTWKGNQIDTPEASAARRAEAMSADAAVKAAAARVAARIKAERALHEERKEELLEAAEAAAAQLRANTTAALRRRPTTPRRLPYPWGPPKRAKKPPPRPAERFSRLTLEMTSPYAAPLPVPRAWAVQTQNLAPMQAAILSCQTFPPVKAMPQRQKVAGRTYSGPRLVDYEPRLSLMDYPGGWMR